MNPRLVSMFKTGVSGPADFAGLRLWLDAAQGLYNDDVGGTAVTTDGTALGRWEDLSGNGFHALQDSFSFQPVLKTGIINSLPVVRFDGSNDFIRGAISGITGDCTIFIVCAIRDANNSGIFDSSDATAIINLGKMIFKESGNIRVRIGSNFGNDMSYTNSSTSFQLLTANHSASARSSWLNGASQATNSGTISNTGLTMYQLGCLFSSVYIAAIDIAELIVYNSAFSVGDQETIESYLGTKYNLTIT